MNIHGNLSVNCSDNSQVFSGRGQCEFTESLTKSLIITKPKKTFDFSSFETDLATALYASGMAKAWIVSGVVDNAMNGGDVATVQEGTYGATKPDGLNAADQAFQIRANECLAKRLMGFNGQLVRLFTVDDNSVANGEIDADGNFVGKLGYIYITYSKMVKGTAANLTVHFYYADYQDYLYKMSGVALKNELPDGLVPLTLEKVGEGVVKLVEACSRVDVTADYGSEIDVSIFVDDSGSNPATATYADGKVTLAPTGKYRVAPASILKSADILGYDGIEEYIKI